MPADQSPLEAPQLDLPEEQLEQLKLPQELLTALDRHSPKRKGDFRLEIWNRPSFFRRFFNKLLGKH
jgi:hypothetical protein